MERGEPEALIPLSEAHSTNAAAGFEREADEEKATVVFEPLDLVAFNGLVAQESPSDKPSKSGKRNDDGDLDHHHTSLDRASAVVAAILRACVSLPRLRQPAAMRAYFYPCAHMKSLVDNATKGASLTKEERERKIYRFICGTLMVGLLSYGVILIAYQSYNQKKRTDLPQIITLLRTG